VYLVVYGRSILYICRDNTLLNIKRTIMKKQRLFGLVPIFILGFTCIVLNGCDDENNDIIHETIPVLTTNEVTNVTTTSALSGGIITEDGGTAVTSRGVVWNTGNNPSIENHFGKTSDGTGSGSFTSEMSGLIPKTIYYVRAYATNIAGTAYGNQVVFETIQSLYVLTLGVEPQGAGSVMGGGEYEEGFQVEVVASANEGWEFVAWTGDTDYVDDPDSEQTTVTMPAKHILLTANFQEKEEDTNIIYGDGVTDIDGNEYVTVIIGTQEWMAENLRVTRDANGNDITRFCYDNDPEWCDLYGGLYTWGTLMNGQSSSDSNPSGVQGICPEGWHVPSDDEWTQLVDYVVSQGFPNSSDVNGAGNALKSCRQENSPLGGDCNTSEHPRWDSHDTHHGFDEFGFSALPGGFRELGGSFVHIGFYSLWWSSTELSSNVNFAWHYRMYLGGSVGRSQAYRKTNGFSLRCVRDLD